MGEATRADVSQAFDDHEPLPDWLKTTLLVGGAAGAGGALGKRFARAGRGSIASAGRGVVTGSPARNKQIATRWRAVLNDPAASARDKTRARQVLAELRSAGAREKAGTVAGALVGGVAGYGADQATKRKK